MKKPWHDRGWNLFLTGLAHRETTLVFMGMERMAETERLRISMQERRDA